MLKDKNKNFLVAIKKRKKKIKKQNSTVEIIN